MSKLKKIIKRLPLACRQFWTILSKGVPMPPTVPVQLTPKEAIIQHHCFEMEISPELEKQIGKNPHSVLYGMLVRETRNLAARLVIDSLELEIRENYSRNSKVLRGTLKVANSKDVTYSDLVRMWNEL